MQQSAAVTHCHLLWDSRVSCRASVPFPNVPPARRGFHHPYGWAGAWSLRSAPQEPRLPARPPHHNAAPCEDSKHPPWRHVSLTLKARSRARGAGPACAAQGERSRRGLPTTAPLTSGTLTPPAEPARPECARRLPAENRSLGPGASPGGGHGHAVLWVPRGSPPRAAHRPRPSVSTSPEVRPSSPLFSGHLTFMSLLGSSLREAWGTARGWAVPHAVLAVAPGPERGRALRLRAH